MTYIKKNLFLAVIISLTLLSNCTPEEKNCIAPLCLDNPIYFKLNFKAYPDSTLGQFKIIRIDKDNTTNNDTLLLVDGFIDVSNKTFDIGWYIDDDPEGYELTILLNEKVEHSITDITSKTTTEITDECPDCPSTNVSSLVLNDDLISNSGEEIHEIKLIPVL